MDKRAVEVPITGITQDGMSPFTMRCMQCGEEWHPKPPRGKTEVTDTSLDNSAKAHWKVCTGNPARRRKR